MDPHFAAFSFVDRITDFEPGARARATFAIPFGIGEFPSCLVAEAVGQLAAWAAMSHIDFRGRPVAALATETLFHHAVMPGDALQLAVDIHDCDDAIVAYSGRAEVDGRVVIELLHCLGPMLPASEFDSPQALRERLALLRASGATPGRFGGVDLPDVVITEHQPQNFLRATVKIPPEFIDLANPKTVSPAEVEDAFIKVNPGLPANAIAVTCNRSRLSEVRICLNKDLQFRACEEIDRRACKHEQVVMPPVRGG